MKTTIKEVSRVDLLVKTIDNLEYMMKIDNNPKTLYDAVRWSYFKGICEDILLQYNILEEKFEDLEQRIGMELKRFQQQEEF